ASPIPIVANGGDLVRAGLVASMNRPGGNVTGVNALLFELSGKHLSLLHDLVPKAATNAVLFDPGLRSDTALRGARDAAAALGQKLLALEAGTAEEIDAQFASLGAILVTVSRFSHSGGADRDACCTPPHPRTLSPARVCRSRRPHELWV